VVLQIEANKLIRNKHWRITVDFANWGKKNHDMITVHNKYSTKVYLTRSWTNQSWAARIPRKRIKMIVGCLFKSWQTYMYRWDKILPYTYIPLPNLIRVKCLEITIIAYGNIIICKRQWPTKKGPQDLLKKTFCILTKKKTYIFLRCNFVELLKHGRVCLQPMNILNERKKES
jgi:uncharacterized ubiquitin-like protein YukD